jgi:lipoprotein-anchoring transpeptidase ErfK/SrfK
VVVDRGTCRLVVWRGQLPIFACMVAVGAPATPTPAGSTRIAERVRDPEWRDPATGKVHPPGSPGNVLASRWLGFDPGPERRFAGIGLHGYTAAPPATWLGRASSHGCLRLAREDIDDLFDLLPAGTPVAVR